MRRGKGERLSFRVEKGLRVFRTSYRGRDGNRRYTDHWYVELSDHQRTTRRLPAFTNRAASEELARKLRKLVMWKMAGELPDAGVTQWLATMPDAVREKLAEWGLLDGRRVAAGKPLAEHLGDWRVALTAKGNTGRHAELVTVRAAKVIEGCGFRTWTDISASRVMEYLSGLRADVPARDAAPGRKGISAQTFNFYLQAVKQFCRWMVEDRRAAESPMTHLKGLNVRTDRRHDRRALAPDELRRLLEATEKAAAYCGITGAERALVYRLAAETGLRAGRGRPAPAPDPAALGALLGAFW